MAPGSRKHTSDIASDIIAVGLGAAILATPSLIPPCTHEILTASGATVPMRCHWSFQIVRLLGLAIVVGTIVLLAVPKGTRRKATAEFLVFLAALVVAATQPWIVGLCGNSEMACHTTAHWVWLWSGFLAIAGAYARFAGQPKQTAEIPQDPWEQASVGTGTNP